MSNANTSYIVEPLRPRQTGKVEPLAIEWFERFLPERKKFGGVRNFVRATGAGLWQDDGHVEEDSIVVIEVTTANIDPCFWAQLRECP